MNTKSFFTNVDRHGNNILWRGIKNGQRFSKKVKFQPTLFVSTNGSSDYVSLHDKTPVQPKVFGTMAEAKEFIGRYADVEGINIYGNTNYVAQFIQEHYPTAIEFDPSLIRIFMYDIEIDISTGFADMAKADKEVTSIAFKSSHEDIYYVLGRKDYDKTKTITGIDPDKIVFVKFETEAAMLRYFVKYFVRVEPDVISGWNCMQFDVPYTINRITRVLGESAANELSPWGLIKKKTVEIFGKPVDMYTIVGISIVDYMEVFKKFGYKYGTQQSYKLDHVAHTVLGKKKLSYEDYGGLSELYEKNPQLYLDYNLQDTHLIELFEQETGLISLVYTVAYKGGSNYNDAFGTVGIWDTTIYRKLMLDKIVPPIKKRGSSSFEQQGLQGGYVKDPQVGMHKWVVSFDLNSLYPNLMNQYNMSPETYMGKNVETLRSYIKMSLERLKV